MKELEIQNKELQEKIALASEKSIKPFDENVILSYLKSFRDLDYSLEFAKQRLVDLFVNRIILYNDHADIYFNTSDDKNTHIPIKKQPEDLKGSDCLHLAGRFL